jgi:hypothetical protein
VAVSRSAPHTIRIWFFEHVTNEPAWLVLIADFVLLLR